MSKKSASVKLQIIIMEVEEKYEEKRRRGEWKDEKEH